MSETPISPLRQRMIEDMTVRKLGAATQRNYIRAVKALSEFLGRSPAAATAEDLRRFQGHRRAPMTRGFLPWRLSDAGPGAYLTLATGRHPKPFTRARMSALPQGRGKCLCSRMESLQRQ